jgi:putative endonuclease
MLSLSQHLQKMKQGYVYILSNFSRTTFYIGVTSNLEYRIAEHRNGTASAFTSKYKLFYLVYFEEYQSIQLAIAREKHLKRWHREWKINLIKSTNPEMKDLMDFS